MQPTSTDPIASPCLCAVEGAPVPLLGVELRGDVFGAHARLVLRQRYRNVEARPIEAIYTFPVPSEASVVGFAMEANGRRFDAEVKDKDEAFQAYDDALAKGHGAALLDEERRNVFTASIGNLVPGEETVVEVAYVQALEADEGDLRLMVPTLVAPRYIPGSPAGDRSGDGSAEPTDRVPDADRISPPMGDVAYGLTVDVTFDLGRPVRVESPSHAIAVEEAPDDKRRVRLVQEKVLLDRDLVLVASGAGSVAAGVVADRCEGADGTFALTIVPDLFEPGRKPASRDVVFVVDVSGSMGGTSIDQARTALRLCLRHLAEGDRFQIVAFSDTFFQFRPEAVPFSQRTLDEADAFVARLEARGGTEMLEPLLAAVKQIPPNAERDRIIVLLTDGQVGNEKEIVDRVAALAQGIRVYALGIGTNVSELLVNDLARRTRGASELIHPGERIDDKVTAQLARALSARVEGVRVKFDGLDTGELAPAAAPDLVDGKPWVLYGRFASAGSGRVEVRGTLHGERFFLEVPMTLPMEARRDGLAQLWARARIRDLDEATDVGERRAGANRQRIVALSVEHKIASAYASFVVVETRAGERRVTGHAAARTVPVNAPAGWASGSRQAVATVFAKHSNERSPAPAPLRAMAMAAPAFAPMDPSGGAPPPAAFGRFAAEQGALAETPKGLTELFAKQLANGLWPAESEDGAALLLAAARAFVACLEGGVDTAHPVYGGPLRKAVAEVAARATELIERGCAREAMAALAGAYAVASGKRLRARVESALAALGPEARAKVIAKGVEPNRGRGFVEELLRRAEG